MFVVEDEDGDIDVYTGIKNVPDITMTATASDPAAMGYVYKKDTGYATYVFIGLEDTDSKVDDASSDDSYIFVIGFDKTLKDSEDTYYRYKAIVDGSETKILTDDKDYADNDSRVNGPALYGKIKTSASTGRITDMTLVETGEPNDKCYADTLSGSVAYSAGVLSIGSKDYSVDSDTQIVLIIDYKYSTDANKETLQSVMSDEDADYEIDNCSASSLKSILAGYSVTGEFYAITDDDYTDSDTLDFLFVHVTGAVEL